MVASYPSSNAKGITSVPFPSATVSCTGMRLTTTVQAVVLQAPVVSNEDYRLSSSVIDRHPLVVLNIRRM